MGFIPYSYDFGQPLPNEYLKVAAGDITAGLCMALSGGKLAKSATPDYIAMCDIKDAADGTVIPAVHITGDVVFEAPLAEGSESLQPGAAAGVSADGLSVSASASKKNIQIISADGSVCRCRFAG